ncbi:MAG: hypothetical protein RL448_473 [Actinomycetota bacterium]|jgi:RNA polymerase-binding transcription factor DksA
MAIKKKPAKKVAKKAAPKKAAKKAPAKKPAKKAPAKKVAKKPAKKAVAKKGPAKPFPTKGSIIAGSKATLKVDTKTQTVSVSQPEKIVAAAVVEEKRLFMAPPPPPKISGKKVHLKPLKAAPTAVVANDNENWTATELKSVRSQLAKELEQRRAELAAVEAEMDSLIKESGEGSGDDQADAGNKTFEREHEMSLWINAKDMVLQTERAIERIDNKTYGRCEECGSPIGKARLDVFPRATLCMVCKQKEERR